MWAYRYDMRGKDLWINLVINMRDDPPRAPPMHNPSAAAEDPHYFLRDTNSPSGSPCGGKATAWVDLPLAGQRAYDSGRLDAAEGGQGAAHRRRRPTARSGGPDGGVAKQPPAVQSGKAGKRESGKARKRESEKSEKVRKRGKRESM